MKYKSRRVARLTHCILNCEPRHDLGMEYTFALPSPAMEPRSCFRLFSLNVQTFQRTSSTARISLPKMKRNA